MPFSYFFERSLSTVIPGWSTELGFTRVQQYDRQVGNSRLGRTRPQMRNCASGNLEIPGSMLRIAPE
jgi:hypothetical protein